MRRRKNLSQTEFAALLGWKAEDVSMYEGGHKKPSFLRLIAALGIAEMPKEKQPLVHAIKNNLSSAGVAPQCLIFIAKNNICDEEISEATPTL